MGLQGGCGGRISCRRSCCCQTALTAAPCPEKKNLSVRAVNVTGSGFIYGSTLDPARMTENGTNLPASRDMEKLRAWAEANLEPPLSHKAPQWDNVCTGAVEMTLFALQSRDGTIRFAKRSYSRATETSTTLCCPRLRRHPGSINGQR